MRTTHTSETQRRDRWLLQFRVRSLLLVTAAVALTMVFVPWLERTGKIAHCDHYDMGKASAIHWPALGAASCAACHRSHSGAMRPWITLSPKYRLFPPREGTMVDEI